MRCAAVSISTNRSRVCRLNHHWGIGKPNPRSKVFVRGMNDCVCTLYVDVGKKLMSLLKGIRKELGAEYPAQVVAALFVRLPAEKRFVTRTPDSFVTTAVMSTATAMSSARGKGLV